METSLTKSAGYTIITSLSQPLTPRGRNTTRMQGNNTNEREAYMYIHMYGKPNVHLLEQPGFAEKKKRKKKKKKKNPKQKT